MVARPATAGFSVAATAFAIVAMMVTTGTQSLNQIEGAVPLKVTPVTLDPSNASVRNVGRFQFAGGVSIEPRRQV